MVRYIDHICHRRKPQLALGVPFAYAAQTASMITKAHEFLFCWTPYKAIQQQNLREPVFLGHLSTAVQEGCKIAVFSTAIELEHGSPQGNAGRALRPALRLSGRKCIMMLSRHESLSWLCAHLAFGACAGAYMWLLPNCLPNCNNTSSMRHNYHACAHSIVLKTTAASKVTAISEIYAMHNLKVDLLYPHRYHH